MPQLAPATVALTIKLPVSYLFGRSWSPAVQVSADRGCADRGAAATEPTGEDLVDLGRDLGLDRLRSDRLQNRGVPLLAALVLRVFHGPWLRAGLRSKLSEVVHEREVLPGTV